METVETVLLWLLGLVFLGAGGMKALLPPGTLTSNPNMAWVERTGITQARIAGWLELVAALTLIGTALGIAFLGDTVAFAIIAAFGIATIQGLAAVRVHQPADEPVLPNLVLGALALILALLLLT